MTDLVVDARRPLGYDTPVILANLVAEDGTVVQRPSES
jgi:hypothetical protein